MSYVLGIDVGAARTSAAVARPGSDDVEPVDLGDGGCGVASVLHLGADGSLDVGAAAERWADGEPERVVRGFPGRIGDDVPMLLAGEPWAPEELTAWLVRWVVDRVAEREDGPAAGIAVTRPATWDDDRIELLAGALAEQDLDVTFLTTARAAEWHTAAPDDAAPVASAAAGGAALALLAGDVEAERTDDVAAQHGRARAIPGDTGSQDGRRPGRRPVRRRAGPPHPRLGAAGPRTTHRLPTGRGPAPTRASVGSRDPARTRRPSRVRAATRSAMRAPADRTARRRRPERVRALSRTEADLGRRRRRGGGRSARRRSAGSPAPSAPPTRRACCRVTRRRPGWHCPRPAAGRPL